MKPLIVTALAAAFAFPAAALAQTFPTKPITIVVPYPAGGTTDTLARVMAEPLGKLLGQSVVVDNKPGASAIVGTKAVANAAPDGHTLLMPNNALAITPHVSKDAGWTIKDFAPISMVSLQPMVLITNPTLPVQTVAQLIDYAKANPGKIDYATAGPASFGHLATELFMRQAGIQMTHIPYKGTAPIAQALLTGEVKLLLSTTTSQMNQYVKEGRLRMIGVASAEPSPLAPGAEPIMKTLKDYQAEVWFGLLAPAGTPKAVVAKLNEAIVKVLQMAEVRARFESTGAAPAPSTPEQFAARIADENASWSKVVREANIKTE
ncbi:MAG: tripartite tricarboxylate transporter substrate binding protein [Proteobacteria bacterium]|nr:tripartite tricarboxylate transporter substrate binding protein [Pseudomonadota bacterium]